MNKDILNTGIQNFINENLNTDISSLLLKYPQIDAVDTKLIAEQIQAKLKSKQKLPTWFKAAQIYYPNKLNIEQTSSEKTAIYKSNLLTGERLLDLTGGFGVDSFYFAKVFKKVIHCEINPELSAIAKHNFHILEQRNIECLSVDGIEFLKHPDLHLDCIYLDPSRRDQSKKKVFLLQDCTPDITEVHHDLLRKANTVLVKVSPLVDITKAIQDVTQISEIHIVAVDNQVKELLFLINMNSGDTRIKAVNIKNEATETFSFDYTEESQATAIYSPVKAYLYEPNASILKSGGFHMVSKRYALNKLHPSTHLYSSDTLIDFPGRRFIVKHIIPYNKQGVKILKGYTKANISIRNFPQTVETLRNKLKIQDGGTDYIFFTTDQENQKIAIITEKIPN